MSEVDMSKYELIPTAEALEYTKQQLAGFDETLNSLCVEAQRDTLQTAFQLAVATTDGSSIPETERNMVCEYFFLKFFNEWAPALYGKYVCRQRIKEYEGNYYDLH